MGMQNIDRDRHAFHVSRFIFYVLLAIIFTGCSAIPRLWENGSDVPAPEIQPTATLQVIEATATPSSSAPKIITLKVWVPPQFEPGNETLAGEILQARLDEFAARRPQVEVAVRVKALSGTGGVLESLRASRDAASLALPDLIILPRPLLEDAADEGLIYPLDELTNAMADENWYEYAQQLSRYNEQIMGLPFAGDVLLTAYRPSVVEDPPVNWETVLSTKEVLVFPASDEEALATFALYGSVGGAFVQEEGELLFDEGAFIEVLSFFQQGWEAGVMPYWITQFETESQAWTSYQEKQSQLAFVWFSRYLSSPVSDTAFTSLPTQEGKAFSIANGWVWSLVSSEPERQELSVELAEFLTANDFVAEWTSQAGYVPPRPSALEIWAGNESWGVLEQVLQSAQIIPSQSVLDKLGPLVRDAVVSVLKDQVTPEEAILTITGGDEAQ
ncbi:MAG: hypothetical protein DRI56_09200 [Chloroflexota bacterium]|nr:MAG: hypothetical protein DRI56_09200 [Chloroflexota bacterium]